jgi:drug/metabolite transporter (DMT)-like permease
MAGLTKNRDLWIPFTCALIVWRLVFSLALTLGDLRLIHHSFRGHDSEYWILHALRAVLTLSAQVCQVLALSWDRPIIAWPILNATGLFAIVISFLVLKERASSRESIAILFIAVIGLVRMAL